MGDPLNLRLLFQDGRQELVVVVVEGGIGREIKVPPENNAHFSQVEIKALSLETSQKFEWVRYPIPVCLEQSRRVLHSVFVDCQSNLQLYQISFNLLQFSPIRFLMCNSVQAQTVPFELLLQIAHFLRFFPFLFIFFMLVILFGFLLFFFFLRFLQCFRRNFLSWLFLLLFVRFPLEPFETCLFLKVDLLLFFQFLLLCSAILDSVRQLLLELRDECLKQGESFGIKLLNHAISSGTRHFELTGGFHISEQQVPIEHLHVLALHILVEVHLAQLPVEFAGEVVGMELDVLRGDEGQDDGEYSLNGIGEREIPDGSQNAHLIHCQTPQGVLGVEILVDYEIGEVYPAQTGVAGCLDQLHLHHLLRVQLVASLLLLSLTGSALQLLRDSAGSDEILPLESPSHLVDLLFHQQLNLYLIIDKHASFVKDIIVPRAIQQSCLDLLLWGILGQYHCVCLLRLDVGVQVHDLDAHLEVVQECHDGYLISLLIHGLDLQLAVHLNRDVVLNECFVQRGVVLEFTRSQESKHQDQVVRDVGVAEKRNNVVDVMDLVVVQSLNKHLLNILEYHP